MERYICYRLEGTSEMFEASFKNPISFLQELSHAFIFYYNIDRTLRALWLVKTHVLSENKT